MASIFVQIAAYRDKELSPTILDAIEKSSGKHEINFGVHIIYLNSSEIKLPDIKNLKYTTSRAPQNLCLGVGRALAH